MTEFSLWKRELLERHAVELTASVLARDLTIERLRHVLLQIRALCLGPVSFGIGGSLGLEERLAAFGSLKEEPDLLDT